MEEGTNPKAEGGEAPKAKEVTPPRGGRFKAGFGGPNILPPEPKPEPEAEAQPKPKAEEAPLKPAPEGSAFAEVAADTAEARNVLRLASVAVDMVREARIGNLPDAPLRLAALANRMRAAIRIASQEFTRRPGDRIAGEAHAEMRPGQKMQRGDRVFTVAEAGKHSIPARKIQPKAGQKNRPKMGAARQARRG